MLNIKHILFPIDFSERCCGAGPFVGAMARQYNAKITMLSVLQPFWYSTMGEIPVPIDVEELKQDLACRLAGAFVKQFDGLKVDRVVEVGDPAATITQFARDENVDVIMMPSHGYGPFRSLLLGSVTAKVLHDAHCPVWTGAHMEAPTALEHLAYRSILCAVDETPKSIDLMKWAANCAADMGATLRLVHVVPGAETWPERQFDGQFEEALRQDAREKVTAMQNAAGVTAPLCVTVGDIPKAIHEEVRRHGGDLLIIGRGLSQETLGRLRTHSYGIIREASCPVLSI